MSQLAAADGTPLHEITWSTEGEAVGTAVLVHGYGEHIGRYDEVARLLTAGGFAVRGYDQRGHGRSGGVRGFCERFSEYTSDLSLIVGRARAALPGKPLFVVSHSFGALVTGTWLLEQPRELAGWVVSSPYFKLKLEVPKAKELAGKVMSSIYPKLMLPSGLKGADVSRDPEIQRAYDADPLNNKNATARWFTEANRAQAELLRRAHEIRVPSLFLVGADDRVADPRRAEEVFARLGSADKKLEMLAGQFHEVFNEPVADRQKAFAMLTAWLKEHARSGAGTLRAEGA